MMLSLCSSSASVVDIRSRVCSMSRRTSAVVSAMPFLLEESPASAPDGGNELVFRFLNRGHRLVGRELRRCEEREALLREPRRYHTGDHGHDERTQPIQIAG